MKIKNKKQKKSKRRITSIYKYKYLYPRDIPFNNERLNFWHRLVLICNEFPTVLSIHWFYATCRVLITCYYHYSTFFSIDSYFFR